MAVSRLYLSPLKDGRPVKDVTSNDILLGRGPDEVCDHVCPVAKNLQQASLLCARLILASSWLLVEGIPATHARSSCAAQDACHNNCNMLAKHKDPCEKAAGSSPLHLPIPHI